MEETNATETNFVPSNPPGVVLNSESLFYLNSGAKWARFLGILGFILSGFIFIAAIFAGSILAFMLKINPMMPANIPVAGLTGFITAIYILMALLYFFPSLYLYKFGANAGRGVLFSSGTDVMLAMKNLKSFLKFWGILAIIALIFIALSFAGAFISILAALNMHS